MKGFHYKNRCERNFNTKIVLGGREISNRIIGVYYRNPLERDFSIENPLERDVTIEFNWKGILI